MIAHQTPTGCLTSQQMWDRLTDKQREEAGSSDNRWYAGEKFGYDPTAEEALVYYYLATSEMAGIKGLHGVFRMFEIESDENIALVDLTHLAQAA